MPLYTKNCQVSLQAFWTFVGIRCLVDFFSQVEQLTDQFCNDTDILLEEKTKELLRKWKLIYPWRKLRWWCCYLRCLVLKCWKYVQFRVFPCGRHRDAFYRDWINPLKETNPTMGWRQLGGSHYQTNICLEHLLMRPKSLICTPKQDNKHPTPNLTLEFL